jgi:hypothetical protein
MRGRIRAAAVVVLMSGAAWGQCGQDWSQTAAIGPSARTGHAMAYDSARGRVVLFGGSGGTSPPGDTWEWDGATWTMRATTGPSPRSLHAMAYDSGRGVTVLFGGNIPGLADTWEWDGNVWTQRMVSEPTPRGRHAMAYDAARGRTVLFGGSFNNTPLGDTWEWDGSAWMSVAASGPRARYWHAMAYDSVRQRVVMIGGDFINDTHLWEFDGAAWTVRALPEEPPTMYNHAVTFDSGRGRLIAVGGFEPGGTWEMDSAAGAWFLRSSNGVSNRFSGAMAYDAARARAVYFGGGFGAGGFTGDTWTWDGSGAAPTVTSWPLDQHIDPGQTAMLTVAATGTGALSYQWLRRGQALSNGGNISGVNTATLTISDAGVFDTAPYQVRVTDSCGSVTTSPAVLYVDCIANCDQSTIPPVLNIDDFICYQAQFASGDSRANCDQSTTPPVLNVNDFVCFMHAFAGGCR